MASSAAPAPGAASGASEAIGHLVDAINGGDGPGTGLSYSGTSHLVIFNAPAADGKTVKTLAVSGRDAIEKFWTDGMKLFGGLKTTSPRPGQRGNVSDDEVIVTVDAFSFKHRKDPSKHFATGDIYAELWVRDPAAPNG